MQRLPASMLQEIQREREGEGEPGTGRAGAAAERGQRVGADASPEASKAPIVFTTPFFAAGPSRAPPLLRETDTPPPSSRVEEPSPPRGRTLGTGRPRDRRPSNPSQDSRVRSGTGSGKVRATWWESSTEEVPSQLVGGHFGPDMNSVQNSSQDLSRKDPTPTQGPPIVWTAAFSDPTHLEQVPSQYGEEHTPTAQANSLFKNKLFGAPSPQTPSSSSSSRSSAASSFAYQLRRRVDVRLLRKRSKPVQHTKKQDSTKGKTSPPLRSPTFGAPKVVADSRNEAIISPLDDSNYNSLQAFLGKTSKVAVTSLKLPPPKQPKKVPSKTSSEHRSESPSSGRSPSPRPVQSKTAKPRRPGILRSSSSRDVAARSSSPQVRPRPRPFQRTSSRESPTNSLRAASHIKQTSSSSRTTPVSPLAAGPLPTTPGSSHTGKSETNPFQTDDSYFSILRTKMTSRQGFTPTLSPTKPEQSLPSPVELPRSLQPETQQETWPGMSSDAVAKRQKRGSIFNVFGLPVPVKAADPASLEKTDSQDLPTRPAMATWPKASTDAEKTQWRRMSEDPPIPPYFTRRRRANTISALQPSPEQSSGSTRATKDVGLSKTHDSYFQEHIDTISQSSLFTPLPPLREDYDRTRRVSIEIPGTPGIHHHPLDTPDQSPLVDKARSPGASPVPPAASIAESMPIPCSFSARRFTFHLPSSTDEEAPIPPPTMATIHKRSSVLQDIASELVGTPNRRKSLTKGGRPVRLLQRRRPAITPIVRQATSASIASQTTKPIKRSMTVFKKSHHSTSLSTNPKE
jgi:hypothetical protein